MAFTRSIDTANTPFAQAIDYLLENDLTLDGLISDIEFSQQEIDQLFTAFSLESAYVKDLLIGNSLSTYSLFTHFDAESGYSIWKYPISNYLDDSDNVLFLDDIALDYRGQADVETQTYFDVVKRYDLNVATPVFEDLTTDVQNEGTSSTIIADDDDYIYIGHSNIFSLAVFELDTLGTGAALQVEYYQNAVTPGWTDVSGLVDGTNNMTQNGSISYTEPTDWLQTTIDGDNKYWLRISSTTGVDAAAKVKTLTRGNAVADLLLMNGSQIANSEWSWAYYNNYLYISIPNTGRVEYEGQAYLKSTSTDANKKNYFITNHEYKINHAKASYSTSVSLTFDETIVVDLSSQTGDSANDFIRIIPGDSLTTAELVLDHNDNGDVTTALDIKRYDNSTTPIKEWADVHVNDIIAEGDVTVTGYVQASDFRVGDLTFANNMKFIEVGDDLVLVNQDELEIFRISRNGELFIKGVKVDAG